MKALYTKLLLLFIAIAMFVACTKEKSFEVGLSAGNATGQLVDSLGICKRADVQGSYQVDTPLNTATNYAVINVNFTSQGKYKIYSDTVNGMWFVDSGFTVVTGPTTIKLKGYGTPILPKVTDFSLFFLNTLCTFSVNVGGTVTPTPGTGSKNDYFPTTSGSTFDYVYDPAIKSTTSFNVNVATGLLSYNGFDYAQFATNLLDTFYFAKDGAGVYYALSTIDFDYTLFFDSYPSTATDYFMSYPFLKENLNVGESWSTADYGPVEKNGKKGVAKAVFTIAEKNTTHTVGGNTYSDVIGVKRIIMFKEDSTSTYTNMLEGTSYYAKNYGLIDQVITTAGQKVSASSVPVIK